MQARGRQSEAGPGAEPLAGEMRPRRAGPEAALPEPASPESPAGARVSPGAAPPFLPRRRCRRRALRTRPERRAGKQAGARPPPWLPPLGPAGDDAPRPPPRTPRAPCVPTRICRRALRERGGILRLAARGGRGGVAPSVVVAQPWAAGQCPAPAGLVCLPRESSEAERRTRQLFWPWARDAISYAFQSRSHFIGMTKTIRSSGGRPRALS